MGSIQTTKGVLKYRNPTIIESIKLVKILREHIAHEDIVAAKLEIMENIQGLLDFSELEGIKTFEEFNKHGEEMTSALFQIAGDILDKVVGSFAKKD